LVLVLGSVIQLALFTPTAEPPNGLAAGSGRIVRHSENLQAAEGS
jgi:hypothetical protein